MGTALLALCFCALSLVLASFYLHCLYYIFASIGNFLRCKDGVFLFYYTSFLCTDRCGD